MILKKKVILVDDMYEWFVDNVKMACEVVGFCELVETREAKTATDAFNMIKEHPEADFILLDGTFESGDCLSVVPYLNDKERKKIICYSATPSEWLDQLNSYGIYHHSSKDIDFPGCILGTCSCAKTNLTARQK